MSAFFIYENGVELYELRALLTIIENHLRNVFSEIHVVIEADKPHIEFIWDQEEFDDVGGRHGYTTWVATFDLIHYYAVGWNMSPISAWGEWLVNAGKDWDIQNVAGPEESDVYFRTPEDFATDTILHHLEFCRTVLGGSKKKFSRENGEPVWALETGDGHELAIMSEDSFK